MTVSDRSRVLSCIFGLALLIPCLASCGREPTYGGKSLSVWLNRLAPQNAENTREEARDAVRQIGTNALPFLIKELDDLEGSSVADFHKTALEKRRYAVNAAFNALGTTARPAIPILVRIMNGGGNASCSAARALVEIGSEGCLPVAAALTNGPLANRICIATFITDAGTNAFLAVPSLLNCLRVRSAEKGQAAALRSFAATALGAIGANSDEVVPALIETLKDENPAVRMSAARALGRFGKRANAAALALRSALSDTDYHVRGVAELALKQVESPQ